MANGQNVHINVPLSNFAAESYKQAPLIWNQIFPVLPVMKSSDKYKKFDGSGLINNNLKLERTRGEEAKQILFQSTDDTYTTEELTARYFIHRDDDANADSIMKLDQRITQRLTNQIGIQIEVKAKTLVENTSTFTDATPGVKWDAANTDAMDIEGDIDTGKIAIAKACGVRPNTIVIPEDIAKVVKKNAAIRELIKYTQSDLLVNGDLPPSIFNLKVIIPGAINNASALGQSPSGAFAWNADKVEILYVEPPSISCMGVGVSFCNSSYGAQGWRVKKYDDKAKDGRWIEVGWNGKSVVTNASAGYIINDPLT